MTNDNLERMYIFIELFVFILWDNNRKNRKLFSNRTGWYKWIILNKNIEED